MAHGHEDFKRRTEIQVNAPDVDFSELVAVLTNLVTIVANAPGITTAVLSDIAATIVNLYSANPEIDLSGLAAAISGLVDLPIVIPGSEDSEIPVRLESIVNFDRKGAVIFLNGFEGSLGAFELLGGVSPDQIEKTTDSVKNGMYGVRLTPLADPNKFAGLQRFQAAPFNNRVGFELSFTYNRWLTSYNWSITNYNIPQYWRAFVKLVFTAYGDPKDIQISTPGLMVTIDPAHALFDHRRLFHTLKLVVDFDTHKYVRLILDNVIFDLSDYDLNYSYSSTQYPHLHTYFQVQGTSEGLEDMFIDDWILTDNEP